jgi:hypothetical protein
MPQHGADDVTSNLSYSRQFCPHAPSQPSPIPHQTPNFWPVGLFPLSFSSPNVVSLAPDIRTRYKYHICILHHTAKSFLSLSLSRPHLSPTLLPGTQSYKIAKLCINIHIYKKYERRWSVFTSSCSRFNISAGEISLSYSHPAPFGLSTGRMGLQ